MNGPDHFREAEMYAVEAAKHASQAAEATFTDEPAEAVRWREWARHDREMGLLHATLALAAATALNDHVHTAGGESVGGMPVQDWDAWKAIAAVQPERGEGR